MLLSRRIGFHFDLRSMQRSVIEVAYMNHMSDIMIALLNYVSAHENVLAGMLRMEL